MASDRRQGVVLYTSQDKLSDELFLYIYAHVADTAGEVDVVAVKPLRRGGRRSFARGIRKCKRLGLLATAEIVTSSVFRRKFAHRDRQAVAEGIRALTRPNHTPDLDKVFYASDLNGPTAVATLRDLSPAILVQAGAGLLQPQVFSIPTLGTLNLHHGIAPAIRGADSLYWALWERRLDWMGSTVHFIDAGIDTGQPLAYSPIAPVVAGEGFASLFVRATEGGTRQLARVIGRLFSGQTVEAIRATSGGVYRSTFSGWKMLLLERRLTKQRRMNRALAQDADTGC